MDIFPLDRVKIGRNKGLFSQKALDCIRDAVHVAGESFGQWEQHIVKGERFPITDQVLFDKAKYANALIDVICDAHEIPRH